MHHTTLCHRSPAPPQRRGVNDQGIHQDRGRNPNVRRTFKKPPQIQRHGPRKKRIDQVVPLWSTPDLLVIRFAISSP
jgi:hypothetical protein